MIPEPISRRASREKPLKSSLLLPSQRIFFIEFSMHEIAYSYKYLHPQRGLSTGVEG